MPIIAKETGGREFKPIPAGTHLAICTMVADLGMQEGYSGKPQRKVYVRFEVPDERVEFERDGEKVEGPAVIGKLYTLSLSEKATLRRDLENWRGRAFSPEELKGFDIAKLLRKPVQLAITHEHKDGKTYANLTGLMGLSKDQKARAATLQPEGASVEYSVEAHDEEAFQYLPKWIKEKIEARLTEPAVASSPSAAGDDFDDSIPF